VCSPIRTFSSTPSGQSFVALRGDGPRDGVAGTREREEEGVTLAVDLMPAGCRTALAHDPAVLGLDGCIVVGQLLEQPR
jgi:hypothetical protein